MLEDYTSRTSCLLISSVIRNKKQGRQTSLNARRWHERREHILEIYLKILIIYFIFKCKTDKCMKPIFVFWFNEEANEKLSIHFGLWSLVWRL